MAGHPIAHLIEAADAAIAREDFDAVAASDTDDAVLVLRPGRNAVGRERIREAFVRIAAHFGHQLRIEQAGLAILETGDTALVLARTIVIAGAWREERPATDVYRRDPARGWLCAIDTSYGHGPLKA